MIRYKNNIFWEGPEKSCRFGMELPKSEKEIREAFKNYLAEIASLFFFAKGTSLFPCLHVHFIHFILDIFSFARTLKWQKSRFITISSPKKTSYQWMEHSIDSNSMFILSQGLAARQKKLISEYVCQTHSVPCMRSKWSNNTVFIFTI